MSIRQIVGVPVAGVPVAYSFDRLDSAPFEIRLDLIRHLPISSLLAIGPKRLLGAIWRGKEADSKARLAEICLRPSLRKVFRLRTRPKGKQWVSQLLRNPRAPCGLRRATRRMTLMHKSSSSSAEVQGHADYTSAHIRKRLAWHLLRVSLVSLLPSRLKVSPLARFKSQSNSRLAGSRTWLCTHTMAA